MRMRCEKMRKIFVTVVRCDANFDSVFASHLHFAPFLTSSHFCTFFWHILRIFLALFTAFWCINCEISTKKVEKVRKCEKSARSAMRMQNAMRKKCDAMQWALTKKCECECDAKTFSHYHPWSARRFSRVSFHLRFPQGVASVICFKKIIFGPGRSKLDPLAVSNPFKMNKNFG